MDVISTFHIPFNVYCKVKYVWNWDRTCTPNEKAWHNVIYYVSVLSAYRNRIRSGLTSKQNFLLHSRSCVMFHKRWIYFLLVWFLITYIHRILNLQTVVYRTTTLTTSLRDNDRFGGIYCKDREPNKDQPSNSIFFLF